MKLIKKRFMRRDGPIDCEIVNRLMLLSEGGGRGWQGNEWRVSVGSCSVSCVTIALQLEAYITCVIPCNQ